MFLSWKKHTIMEEGKWRLIVEIVVFSLWLIKVLHSKLSKHNFNEIVHIENEVKASGDERCAKVADIFGADRCVYWAISNGEEFISGWSKKKLVALCEYYDTRSDLKSFRDAFLEVSTLRFDRNLKALLDSVRLLKDSNKEKISLSYGDHAKISMYSGVIYVEDEALFKDSVSEINLLYGFRSLAACKAYDKNGKLQGFLILGWKDVKPEGEINISLFRDQGITFHQVIDEVMDKYRLRNKILDKFF